MSSQPNQSLIDGLSCLTHLAAEGGPIAGRELARRLDLHHAKVNRLLMTLAEIGLVRQDEKRRYLPASGLHILAALAGHGSGLLKRARPAIEALHQEWSEATIAIGVLWEEHVAYLYHAGPGAPASRALSIPNLYPARSSSIGMALLEPNEAGYAALVHEHQGNKHRSIAVPIFEHGQAVAALSATTMPMKRRPQVIARRLKQASDCITKHRNTDHDSPPC